MLLAVLQVPALNVYPLLLPPARLASIKPAAADVAKQRGPENQRRPAPRAFSLILSRTAASSLSSSGSNCGTLAVTAAADSLNFVCR